MRFYLDEKARQNGVTPLCAPAPGDAGYDIRSQEHVLIYPGEQAIVATGLYVEIPPGYVGILKDRSSLAQIGLRTAAGVIDSSYRGEIRILVDNRGLAPVTINVNDRIVQMVVVPCYTDAAVPVDTLAGLTATNRGAGGFGSTGSQ